MQLRGLQEGQAVLRDEQAARLQAAGAVGVELPGEQHGAGPDRIGGIDHDHVETLVGLGHEFGAVGDDDTGARIVIGTGRNVGEMRAAEIDHAAVDLAQRGLLHLGMFQHLAQDAAVAAADDQRLFALPCANSGTCAIIS